MGRIEHTAEVRASTLYERTKDPVSDTIVAIAERYSELSCEESSGDMTRVSRRQMLRLV
jgi:hypothetical protein